MNDWLRMTMGLPEPKTAAQIEAAATIEGMRAAIWAALHDSPIIRQCLEAARYRGLNGEDTHTLLAYHALRSLEEHYQRHSDLLARVVAPIIVPQRGDV